MSKHVLNVHERRLGSADAAAVRAALDRLADPRAGVWPADRWPPLRLDRGVVPGSRGGHGPIRYSVEDVQPGGVTFRFDPTMGVEGVHRFEVDRYGDGATIRHTIDATLHGTMRAAWPVLIEPLHDALIEDAFDGLEATTRGGAARRAALTPSVERRRRFLTWFRRLDDDRPTPARRRVAAVTGATLVGIGALHAAWARGLTAWPGRDVTDLARAVVGSERFPSTAATMAVAGLCVTAGAGVAARASDATGPTRTFSHVASRTVAGVLAARGFGGLVVSGLGLAATTPTFRRNDLVVYSPLCLALAGGALAAGGVRRTSREQSANAARAAQISRAGNRQAAWARVVAETSSPRRLTMVPTG